MDVGFALGVPGEDLVHAVGLVHGFALALVRHDHPPLLHALVLLHPDDDPLVVLLPQLFLRERHHRCDKCRGPLNAAVRGVSSRASQTRTGKRRKRLWRLVGDEARERMRVEAKARARVCRTPEPRSRHKFGCVAEQPLELARAAFPGVSGQSTRDTKKTQIDRLFRSGFLKRVFRGREGDGFERQTETASETHRARVHATELKNRPSRLLPHRHPEPELVVLVGVVNLRGEGEGEPRVEALLEERGDHAVVVDAPAQAALP